MLRRLSSLRMRRLDFATLRIGTIRADTPCVARPRHQDGWLQLYRGKKRQSWVAHWYTYEYDEAGVEHRKHHSKKLGDRTDLTREEAHAELRKILVQAGQAIARPRRVTLAWFVDNVWIPLREGTWKPLTRRVILSILDQQIKPKWGAVLLSEIQAPDAAKWLTLLAKSSSFSLVRHCRTYLRAILSDAVDQDYLGKSPLRRLALPRTKKPRCGYLTAEQVAAIAEKLKGRDRLVFQTFVLCGFRPGELSALQWGDLMPDGIFVQRAFVEGVIVEPKTRGSLAPVAIPDTLRAALLAERNGAPDHAFVFANRKGGPFPANNWRFRVLVPAARAAGFEGQINFQVLRRTFATLAHDLGVPLKAVQAQLRHASTATTANVYTQIVTATQKAAVEIVAKKLFSE